MPPPSDPPRVDAGSDVGAKVTCPSSTAEMQSTFLATRCGNAGCHGAISPALALDLVSPDLVRRLGDAPSIGCRGEKLLVPGHPDQSELFRKVAHSKPECGMRMPPDGFAAVSAEEVECLRRWVAELAAPDAGAVDAPTPPDTGPAPDGGACNRACTGGTSCVNGTCTCPAGQTLCGATCVDLKGDAANCGACGTACMAGTVCASGACVRGGCPSGTTTCNGACIDTQTSALHCGACTVACPSGTTCAAGACVCAPGTDACNGACVDTSRDPRNCGGCNQVCAAGSTCLQGKCACASGLTACGSSCVDTTTNVMNCGACGKTCAAGEACTGGLCVGCGPSVSYAAQVQPIFNASCTTNCHSGRRPAGGLGLEPASAYAELVNVTSTCGGRKHVAPGSPGTSYLLNKLTGVDMCAGGVMPKADGRLPQAQIDLIRAWICQGAPKN